MGGGIYRDGWREEGCRLLTGVVGMKPRFENIWDSRIGQVTKYRSENVRSTDNMVMLCQ